jgi:hypothetical protein
MSPFVFGVLREIRSHANLMQYITRHGDGWLFSYTSLGQFSRFVCGDRATPFLNGKSQAALEYLANRRGLMGRPGAPLSILSCGASGVEFWVHDWVFSYSFEEIFEELGEHDRTH